MKNAINKGKKILKKGKDKIANRSKTPKVKDPKRRKKTIKIILLVFLILCILGLTSIGLFLGYIVKNAPDFDPADLYDAEPTYIYDRDGNEVAKLGDKIRSLVTYEQLPQTLIDAIIATEDSRFFQHNGFDLPRFTKATIQQLMGKSDAGGASTLTMQISKNKLTKKGNTKEGKLQGLVRKFTDIYMAIFKIEKTYTKEEIIEFYVNSNYMGANTNGVEDASQAYFGKSVSDLTLSEAAMITGIFNAPDYYDPYKHPEACEQRRQTVLYLLKRHGYINDEEYKLALDLTVDKIVKPRKDTKGEKYEGFIYTVVAEVIDKTGKNPYEIPMKIYSTMDAKKQAHVDSIFNGTNDKYTWVDDKAQGGAAVVSAEDGSIVAIGAGRNRTALGFNIATDSRRQIGSTAKPLYEYALGIEKLNWGTDKVFVDEPWGYTNGVQIGNWDGKFKGFITMRDALIDSTNIPALKAFQAIDNKTRIPWIQSLGLHPEIEDGIIHEAHAIGGYNGESPLSLASAYNAFATKGYYIEPYSVTKIEFNDGSEPYVYKYTMNRVMSEETAWMITNILVDVAKANRYYINGATYALKSGTTNLSKEDLEYWKLTNRAVADLWAVGYTDKYSIAVWHGYESLKDGHNIWNSGQNYRLFAAIARGVFEGKTDFAKPNGVVGIETEKGCYETCLPSEFTPSDMRITQYFKKGYEPTLISDRYAKLDDVTNLKANVVGSNIELTWDQIKTPNAIDKDYLKAYFQNAYENDDLGEVAAENRYNENIKTLGLIVYKVYEQIGDKLVLVKTTDENKVIVTAATANPTFIVKTSYTVFEKNISNGASIKLNGVIASDLITATQALTEVEVKPTDTKIPNENRIANVTVNGIAADPTFVTYQYTLASNKTSGETYELSVKVLYKNKLIDTFNINVKVKD